jgi:hypothetical protein
MGMGAYLCMVSFISVMNFLHDFNGQFLMLYFSGMLYRSVSRLSSSLFYGLASRLSSSSLAPTPYSPKPKVFKVLILLFSSTKCFLSS